MHAHAHVCMDHTHGHPSEPYESRWHARFTRFCVRQRGDEDAL
jgi:hypothetical protein